MVRLKKAEMPRGRNSDATSLLTSFFHRHRQASAYQVNLGKCSTKCAFSVCLSDAHLVLHHYPSRLASHPSKVWAASAGDWGTTTCTVVVQFYFFSLFALKKRVLPTFRLVEVFSVEIYDLPFSLPHLTQLQKLARTTAPPPPASRCLLGSVALFRCCALDDCLWLIGTNGSPAVNDCDGLHKSWSLKRQQQNRCMHVCLYVRQSL